MHATIAVDDAGARVVRHAGRAHVVASIPDRVRPNVLTREQPLIDLDSAELEPRELFADAQGGFEHRTLVVASEPPVDLQFRHAEHVAFARERYATVGIRCLLRMRDELEARYLAARALVKIACHAAEIGE